MSDVFAPGQVAIPPEGYDVQIPSMSEAQPDTGRFEQFEPGSAFAALADLLYSYGLDDLVDTLYQIATEHSDAPYRAQLDMLYQSEPYKKRFPGMEILRKKVQAGEPGYVELSPAQYLQMEDAYRQQLMAYGLPSGFYDEPSDFATWIGGGVSPDEVGRRAKLASEMAQSADAETKDALRRFYGITEGQIAAYFLDPDRVQSQFAEAERQARAAQLAGAAMAAGFDVDQSWRDRAENLASLIDPQATAADMRAGYQEVANDLRVGGGLADRYGMDYGIDDAEDAALLNMPSAQRKRRKMAEAEAATFGGSSGIGSSSLSQSKTDAT